MKILLKQQAWLVLAAGLLFFSFLGSYALFNNVEPITAGSAAEMLRQGTWIVPTFNNQLQTDAPILIDWLLLAAFRLWGVSEWSARITSSVFSIASVLMTYHLGRKLYSLNVGFLAGLILSTCLLFTINGRSATPDSISLFLVTFAFTSYVWLVARQREGHFSGVLQLPPPVSTGLEGDSETRTQPIHRRTRVQELTFRWWPITVPMFLAMGLATLSIGPVGLVLPVAILLAFLLISQWNIDLEQEVIVAPTGPWWRRWPLTVVQIFRLRSIKESILGIHLVQGLGICAIVALPWYLAVTFATNGAWPQHYFLHREFDGSVRSSDGQTGIPLYLLYQLVSLHVGCFPWSVFLPVAFYRLRLRLEERAHAFDSDLLLTCWMGIWFAFYTVISTHESNDLLPMYPAVALVLARYLNDWQFDKVDMWIYSFLLCCRAMWIVGAVMTLGIYVAAYLYFPGEQWLGVVGLIPVIGAIVTIKLVEQEQRKTALRTLVATALLLAFIVVGVAAPRMRPYQDSSLFIADAKQRAKSEEIEIATFRYYEPSVVFYAGKPIPTLGSAREVADFLAGRNNGFVITKATDLNELREELHSNVSELSRRRNFMHGRELILLGRD
ncbi:ArnT family glycosyltransferase [Schlesneria paludicola]|uniref:ArnT family glycosyltransferase n=1 Tax=Schlesneria paludicola TaxID=360056 RepID=UPI00029B1539|nr:glycosyltransferase family 39 protein [Schlesneria paludicola]